MANKNTLVVISFVALILIPGFTAFGQDHDTPNILLIVSEDNGPELGSYGDPYAQTPNLDQLAERGIRFKRAFTTYSVCSPSRASLLTGLYPHQHGQIGLATHDYAMYRSFTNIPEILKEHGYRTGIIGKLHVNPESAFSFDFRWNDGNYISFRNRNVKEIGDQAGFFFNSSDEPFFLMVNYPDAHFPLLREAYGIPKQPLGSNDVKTLPFVGVDNQRLREFTANYYNSLKRLDVGVGQLLEILKTSGKSRNTLVIYLGDHGPQFSRGKTSSYEAALQIPLIMYWPNEIGGGQVNSKLVSVIDLLPTILDATNIENDGFSGKSLLKLAGKGNPSWRKYLFAEGTGSTPFFYFPRRSVRDDRYKLIVNLLQDRENPMPNFYEHPLNAFFKAGTRPREIASSSPLVQQAYATWREAPPVELYDLKDDPYEFNNLATDPNYEKIMQRLLAALKKWQENTEDPYANPEILNKLTQEMDQVISRYPDYGYSDDPNFKWDYHKYLYHTQTDNE